MATKIVRHALAVAGLSLTAACSGTVVMTPLEPTAVWQPSGPRQSVEGVIVYLPVQLVEVDELTQIDANVGGKSVASRNCHHVDARKLVSAPDWRHPWLLNYKSGLLEAHSFSMQMTKDGVLTSINSQSTPDQGKTFENVASGVTSLAGPGKLLGLRAPRNEAALPDCTIAPQFVGYEYPPDIKPSGSYR